MQGIMERMCALPWDINIIHHVVALALEDLECQEDATRKYASSFLGHALKVCRM